MTDTETSSVDTGGPAFPLPQHLSMQPHLPHGMTVRDYFAGVALQGWLATYGDNTHPTVGDDQIRVARDAYAMADAMIAARKEEAP